MSPHGEPLLDIRNVSARFDLGRTGLFGPRRLLHAVRDVTLSVEKGECVGLVGESGCGKSTLAKLVLDVVRPAGGRITFGGRNLTALSPREWRRLRPAVQYVFQDPMSALDPRRTILFQVAEPLAIHRRGSRAEREAAAGEMLDAVGLDRSCLHKVPHELSGGQRQRVVLARALVLRPQLLICDEPVASLDVSVQAQVIGLLQDLHRRFDLTMLFISHDLGLVHYLSDRVAVMYLGRIVELAPTERLFQEPRHPYTLALLSAVMALDPGERRVETGLAGEPPSALDPPSGCGFHPRCPMAQPRCRTDPPQLKPAAHGHWVACHVAQGDV
ncbi:ABC transporter ATP-binding protein [Stella sp.]|uniref:ABC transporter ATP-binding protein n=1 Tax=Stella sp. TaxID=2912054 RepID=UPI0035B40139